MLKMDMPDGLGAERYSRRILGRTWPRHFRMKGCVMDTIMDGERIRRPGLMPISSYSPAYKRRVQADKAGFEFASYVKKEIADALDINPSTLGKRFRAGRARRSATI